MKMKRFFAAALALVCLALAACSSNGVPSLKKTTSMELAELSQTMNGLEREAVKAAWGEPAATVDTYGDVYATGEDSCLILYYSSNDLVNSVMVVPGTPDLYAKAPAETTAAESTDTTEAAQ